MTALLESGASPLDRCDDSGRDRECGARTETENRGKATINLLGMQQYMYLGGEGAGGIRRATLLLPYPLKKDLCSALCIPVLEKD